MSQFLRRLQDEDREDGHHIARLNDPVDASARAAEFSPNIMSTSPLAGYGYPNQRGNNDRSSHLHVTTLDIDQIAERSNDLEDNRTVNEGEVVGYIQGYGPVTADPNISAAVIRGKAIKKQTFLR